MIDDPNDNPELDTEVFAASVVDSDEFWEELSDLIDSQQNEEDV